MCNVFCRSLSVCRRYSLTNKTPQTQPSQVGKAKREQDSEDSDITNDIGMACQNVCKQGRDHSIKGKVNT